MMETYRIIFLTFEETDHIDTALKLDQTLEGSIDVPIDQEHMAVIKVINGKVQVELCYERQVVKDKTFEVDSIVGIYEFEGIVIEVAEE